TGERAYAADVTDTSADGEDRPGFANLRLDEKRVRYATEPARRMPEAEPCSVFRQRVDVADDESCGRSGHHRASQRGAPSMADHSGLPNASALLVAPPQLASACSFNQGGRADLQQGKIALLAADSLY
ncbi:hypothetical protein MTO96_046109, partial [Rhipicephalus appendiculatus]